MHLSEVSRHPLRDPLRVPLKVQSSSQSANFLSELLPLETPTMREACLSGKKKAHKHKQIFPVTARVGEASPDRVARGLPTGGQGSKVYVLCAETKEHKHFRPGTWPGGFGYPAGRIGDQGDREIVYVPNVYVPFPAPSLSAVGVFFFTCSGGLFAYSPLRRLSDVH